MSQPWKFLTQLAIINFLGTLVLAIIMVSNSPLPPSSAPTPTITPTIAPSPSLSPAVITTPRSSRIIQSEVGPTAPPADPLTTHNTPSDCWMRINGRLYDLTTFFGSHPGGDGALAAYCGRDATTAFATKDRSPGTPHSAVADSLLSQYLIR